jgi:hypothetical protein
MEFVFRALVWYPKEPTAVPFWRLRANVADATTYHSEGRS